MKQTSPLQQAMFQDMADKHIFDQAKTYGYAYVDQAWDRHVYPSEEALSQLSVFDEALPDKVGHASDILAHLHTYGSPATVSQIAGRYFGFVNGGVVPAGLAARCLADFWDQNTAMEVISPISAKLESVVESWLKDLFGMPKQTVAGFVSGTSSANFCGLAAARYRILQRQGWDINEQGLFGAPKIRIVTGKHAHSSALKAINLLGFGRANIEWVEVDAQGRLIPEQLPDLDDQTIVVLQAGNVNSGSFDPLEAVCTRAQQANAWVHVDGAFGLWAGGSQRLKHLTAGMELASSWAVDGHKTLNTPYDSGIVLCADPEAIISALHMSGAYLIKGKKRDGMFYTPEMSRRARIIELWATMKYLGKQGIDELIWGMHERAKQFADELTAAGFEILNDVVFNQVLVSCGSDEVTEQTLQRVQELRTCWCGGSSWFGKKVIRISVCNWATTEEDVSQCVASFVQARKDLSAVSESNL